MKTDKTLLRMQYSDISPQIFDSLVAYGETRRPTGDFLRSVLANDLMGALGRADETSRRTIYEVAMFIYNELPGNSHGSYQAVDKWLAGEL